MLGKRPVVGMEPNHQQHDEVEKTACPSSQSFASVFIHQVGGGEVWKNLQEL